MAAVDGKRTNAAVGKNITVTWVLTTGDTGNPVYIGDLSEVTVQGVGAGTSNLQGSNDGTNFGAIGAGLAIAPSSAITQVPAVPGYVSISAVAGAPVTVNIHGKRYS